MPLVRQFDGSIGERAAAVVRTGEMVGHLGKPGAELLQGLARMGRLIGAPRSIRALAHLAEIFGQQFVLGGEMPVERHLVGAGGFRNRIDADGADAMPVEELGCRREQALARGNFVAFGKTCGNLGGFHGWRLDKMLPVGTYAICYRSVPQSNVLVTWPRASGPASGDLMTAQSALRSQDARAAPADPTPLFTPYRLGDLKLKNRFVLSPMTRSRAVDGNVPNPLAAMHYAPRATAGLIVTEATQVSPQGVGYIRTPGIHSPEQVAGWREVTDAVHRAGGVIFAQLWHVGRISHPAFHGGELPVAPSAIAADGEAFTTNGKVKIPTPRALETREIAGIVEQFRRGA